VPLLKARPEPGDVLRARLIATAESESSNRQRIERYIKSWPANPGISLQQPSQDLHDLAASRPSSGAGAALVPSPALLSAARVVGL
jgi:hypothetical protein